MNDRILPWLKFTHASPETFEEYDRLKKAEAELAKMKSIIERLRNRDVLYQKLMKAEAEVRQLTELYDDLAYVCPPEKARAHIMRLEAELADIKQQSLYHWIKKANELEAELAEAKTVLSVIKQGEENERMRKALKEIMGHYTCSASIYEIVQDAIGGE